MSCAKTREGEGNYEEEPRVMGPGPARSRSHLALTRTAPLQSHATEEGIHSQDWKQLGTNYSHMTMTNHYNYSEPVFCFTFTTFDLVVAYGFGG